MLEIQGKFNTAKVFTDNIEPEAYTQLLNMMCQCWAKDMQVRIMPDVHAGKGCTVGTTMTIKDKDDAWLKWEFAALRDLCHDEGFMTDFAPSTIFPRIMKELKAVEKKEFKEKRGRQ